MQSFTAYLPKVLGRSVNRFVPQFRSSYLNLLGKNEVSAEDREARIEAIRQLMLSELGDHAEQKYTAVARRVRFAVDIQGLWYARSEVMAILAANYGEEIAREKIDNISSKFRGLLPSSLTDNNTPKISVQSKRR